MRLYPLSLILLWPFISFANKGKICEDKAFRLYQQQYNHNYVLYQNIEYTKQVKNDKPKPSATLGEIDILVLNRDNEIVEVCEVKASVSGNKRARKQLEKFKKKCIYGKCNFWQKQKRLDIEIGNKDRIIYTIKTFDEFLDDLDIDDGSENDSSDNTDYLMDFDLDNL